MNLRKYLIIGLILALPIVYVLSCNSPSNPSIKNTLEFNGKLSSYGLFKGRAAELAPAQGVELLELSSTLFTDYAKKQRLIRLPKGKKMVMNGNGLPIFPEGTLLAKTFYYEDKKGKRKIIETRLLLFSGSRWNLATYKWNANQTEALLLRDGATVEATFQAPDGRQMRNGYHIPSERECVSCHHAGDAVLPIGLKAQNLNRSVQRGGKMTSQLAYLMDRGLLVRTVITGIKKLPDYNDTDLSLEHRARAYLEINCGHCHSAGGYAGQTTLDLGYGTGMHATGIRINRSNILVRMENLGEYHMPKLGTTVIDREGAQLIRNYIKGLK